jgi:hypothetical protein
MTLTLVGFVTTPNWTSTTAQTTASISIQTGDLLVVKTGGFNGPTNPTIANSGTALTWTLQESLVTASSSMAKIWTATADSNRSLTVTLTPQTAHHFGGVLEVWRGHNGVGAAESRYDTSGIDIPITTTGSASALSMIIADRNHINGASRSYLTVNVAATEEAYSYDSTDTTFYSAYWSNSGAAGAKTVGQPWFGAQNAAIAVIEILAGAGPVDKMGWGILL